MAKSARASGVKANKARLKATVFGPVEQARAERMSAKLQELASQPKPSSSADINIIDASEMTGEGDGVVHQKKGSHRPKPFVRNGLHKKTWLQEARAAKKIRKQGKERKKLKIAFETRKARREKKQKKQAVNKAV